MAVTYEKTFEIEIINELSASMETNLLLLEWNWHLNESIIEKCIDYLSNPYLSD